MSEIADAFADRRCSIVTCARRCRRRIVLHRGEAQWRVGASVANARCFPARDPDLGGPCSRIWPTCSTKCRTAYVQVDPRRPFREPGVARDEVMFVRSGILSKFKTDNSGRRQIVALRFPGEGILPRDGIAEYGIQAIVRSEVMVGKAEDFDPIVDAHPEMQRFFWRLIQRNEAIGYEWLVNCGRRDSTARVAHLLCETAVRMHVDDGIDDQPVHAAADRRHHRADVGQRQPRARRHGAAGTDPPQGPRDRVHRLGRNAPRRELPAELSGDLTRTRLGAVAQAMVGATGIEPVTPPV